MFCALIFGILLGGRALPLLPVRIHLHQYVLSDSYFSSGLQTVSVTYLVLRLTQIWPVGTPPNWLLAPLTCFYHTLSISFNFWQNNMFHVHLSSSPPLPQKQYFFQGALSLLLENYV